MYAHLKGLKKLSLLATIISALTANAANAENTQENAKDEGNKEVEQIVVTGTRTPKSIADSPVPIDIITSADLEMVTTGTLADALEFIPGVVTTRSPKEGYNIMMQGFDSDRVLVLVDGLPLISPTGDSVDLDQISANDIERIEIVRGAASVLYGSSAMGGVVNIFTKQHTGDGLRLSGTLGSYDDYALEDDDTTKNAVFTGHTELGDWNLKVTGQAIDRPGFKYSMDPDDHEEDTASLNKNFVNAQIRTQLPGLKISYQPQYFEEEKVRLINIINGIFDDTIIEYTSDVRQSQHDFALFGDKPWQIKARTNFHKEVSGRTGSMRKARIENHHLDGQNIWGLSWAEVVGGIKLGYQSIEQIKLLNQTVEFDDSRSNAELFTQADFNAGKSWNMVAGFRAQNDSDFGNHTAFRFNTLWSPTSGEKFNFRWRASIGEAYRVPTLKERFYIFDHSALGYVVMGNPDLQPETSLSFNNTFSGSFPVGDSQLDIELAGHYSEAKNLIDSVHNPDKDYTTEESQNVQYNEYTNIEETEISGVDLSLGQSGNFRWQLNYSYLEARDNLADERLQGRPRHQIKANLWLPITENQNLMFFGKYESDRYDPRTEINNSYTIVNTRWDWQITDNFQWKVGVDNIGNVHADPDRNLETEFDITPVSSRYIFTTIEYSLN